jgi:hypothetical protein
VNSISSEPSTLEIRWRQPTGNEKQCLDDGHALVDALWDRSAIGEVEISTFFGPCIPTTTMVKVGKFDTISEYLQSYRPQGIPNCYKTDSDWLRLVIIIGGYILLRPILIRYGARLQEKQLEHENAKVSKEGMSKEKKQDKKDKGDLQWGASARIRQRQLAEGRIQDGEESDSDDLEELLDG